MIPQDLLYSVDQQVGVAPRRYLFEAAADSHRWTIAPQYIEEFRNVRYIFKVSAPPMLRDSSALAAA